MRAARRALAGEERAAAEAALVRSLRGLPVFRSAVRIGAYLAFDGEPDLAPLLAGHPEKEFYVPILEGSSMRFAGLSAHARWKPNSFGIAEPVHRTYIDRRRLDLVLTPLVAFDDHGVRLGVGGGYYDRHFAFLRRREIWFRPKLLGVAFSFQRVPRIEAEKWDVPLWGVVTDAGARTFDSHPR